MSSLKDKIESLIQGLGITSSRFADLIGVNRPIISHILTGRNNPSIDIIQKIVARFPELGYNWIGDNEEIDQQAILEIKENTEFSRESGIPIKDVDNTEILNSQKEKKTITSVMLMYSDGTCKIYTPEEFGM